MNILDLESNDDDDDRSSGIQTRSITAAKKVNHESDDNEDEEEEEDEDEEETDEYESDQEEPILKHPKTRMVTRQMSLIMNHQKSNVKVQPFVDHTEDTLRFE